MMSGAGAVIAELSRAFVVKSFVLFGVVAVTGGGLVHGLVPVGAAPEVSGRPNRADTDDLPWLNAVKRCETFRNDREQVLDSV
jgi:hypothetical protein